MTEVNRSPPGYGLSCQFLFFSLNIDTPWLIMSSERPTCFELYFDRPSVASVFLFCFCFVPIAHLRPHPQPFVKYSLPVFQLSSDMSNPCADHRPQPTSTSNSKSIGLKHHQVVVCLTACFVGSLCSSPCLLRNLRISIFLCLSCCVLQCHVCVTP